MHSGDFCRLHRVGHIQGYEEERGLVNTKTGEVAQGSLRVKIEVEADVAQKKTGVAGLFRFNKKVATTAVRVVDGKL